MSPKNSWDLWNFVSTENLLTQTDTWKLNPLGRKKVGKSLHDNARSNCSKQIQQRKWSHTIFLCSKQLPDHIRLPKTGMKYR